MLFIRMFFGQHYQYELRPGTQILGTKISQAKITLQECQNSCDAVLSCIGFVMQTSTSMCFLGSTNGVQLSRKDFDTYVKGNLLPPLIDTSIPIPSTLPAEDPVQIPLLSPIPPTQTLESIPSLSPSQSVTVSAPTQVARSNTITVEKINKNPKSTRAYPAPVSNSQKSSTVVDYKTPAYVYFLIVIVTALAVLALCFLHFKFNSKEKPVYDDEQTENKFSFLLSKFFKDPGSIYIKEATKFTNYIASDVDESYTPDVFAIEDSTLSRSVEVADSSFENDSREATGIDISDSSYSKQQSVISTNCTSKIPSSLF